MTYLVCDEREIRRGGLQKIFGQCFGIRKKINTWEALNSGEMGFYAFFQFCICVTHNASKQRKGRFTVDSYGRKVIFFVTRL